MKDINVESKTREFVSILNPHFQGKVNLLKLKRIAMFVFALCKVQTVSFEKLALKGSNKPGESKTLIYCGSRPDQERPR